jgi:hypothetical protein
MSNAWLISENDLNGEFAFSADIGFLILIKMYRDMHMPVIRDWRHR